MDVPLAKLGEFEKLKQMLKENLGQKVEQKLSFEIDIGANAEQLMNKENIAQKGMAMSAKVKLEDDIK